MCTKLEFINVHKKPKICINISCTKIRFAQKISELRHMNISKETFLQFYYIQSKKTGVLFTACILWIS